MAKKTKTKSKRSSSKKKALPQGYTRSSYSSKQAVDYMIRKGFVDKLGDLSDMISYPSSGKGSKTAAVNELLTMYEIQYPGMFGMGSAHASIAAHYTKSGSGAGLGKLIDKLEAEGKIQIGEQTYAQQSDPLLKSLQKLMPQIKRQEELQRPNILNRVMYTNVMQQTDNNFNRYVSPLLSKDDKGNIEWASVDALISDQFYGPARLGLSRLWTSIKSEIIGLKASTRFMSGSPSVALIERVGNLQSMITSMVKALADQGIDITSVATGVERQVDAGGGSYRKEAETVDMSTLAGMPTSTKDEIDAFLNKATVFTASRSQFQTKFYDLKKELAQKQSAANTALLTQVIQDNDIVPREAVYAHLKGVAQAISRARVEGQIDNADYNKYKTRFDAMIRKAQTLPTLANLLELAASGDSRASATIAQKKYVYDILIKQIEQFQQEVGNLGKLKVLLDQMKAAGRTKKQIIDIFTNTLQKVAAMAQLTPDQKKAILQNKIGALATKQEYQNATKAVTLLRVTLNRIRSSRNDREARTNAAYYTLNPAANGLLTALALANAALAKDFTKAVMAQKSALATAESAAQQDAQQMAMFLVNPQGSMGLVPFSKLRGRDGTAMQLSVNAIMYTQNMLGSLISSCMVAKPNQESPKDVLASLPGPIRTLGSEQVQARAIASSKMLAHLNSQYSHVVGLAQKLFGGGGGFNTQALVTANIAELKKTLNVAYDKSYSLKGAITTNGLHYCAFQDMVADFSGKAPRAPLAILSAGDLTFYPVFRGDTFWAGDKRTAEYQIGGQKFMAQQQGVLTRRFGRNNLGGTFMYDWNPVNAEDLRSRYFVAMYPFSLNNSAYNQFYVNALADIKGTARPTVAAQGDTVADLLGLTI
jgi:uncharacterized membrane protein